MTREEMFERNLSAYDPESWNDRPRKVRGGYVSLRGTCKELGIPEHTCINCGLTWFGGSDCCPDCELTKEQIEDFRDSLSGLAVSDPVANGAAKLGGTYSKLKLAQREVSAAEAERIKAQDLLEVARLTWAETIRAQREEIRAYQITVQNLEATLELYRENRRQILGTSSCPSDHAPVYSKLRALEGRHWGKAQEEIQDSDTGRTEEQAH